MASPTYAEEPAEELPALQDDKDEQEMEEDIEARPLKLAQLDEYEDEEDFDSYEEEGEEGDVAVGGGAAASTPLRLQFKQVSAARGLCCALSLLEGDLHCWGPSQRTDADHIPSFVKGPFLQVSAGTFGVCAILDGSDGSGGGAVQCWGFVTVFLQSSDHWIEDAYSQLAVSQKILCGLVEASRRVCCVGNAPDHQLLPPVKKLLVA